MTTTTQIGTFDYTIPVEYFGDYAGDFDTAAINAAVLAQLNSLLPEGITLAANGMIFADADLADEAREVDFSAMLADVDVDAIASEYEVTTDDIAGLQQAAGQAGDAEQVRLCDLALEGNAGARAECARVIFEARAEMGR